MYIWKNLPVEIKKQISHSPATRLSAWQSCGISCLLSNLSFLSHIGLLLSPCSLCRLPSALCPSGRCTPAACPSGTHPPGSLCHGFFRARSRTSPWGSFSHRPFSACPRAAFCRFPAGLCSHDAFRHGSSCPCSRTSFRCRPSRGCPLGAFCRFPSSLGYRPSLYRFLSSLGYRRTLCGFPSCLHSLPVSLVLHPAATASLPSKRHIRYTSSDGSGSGRCHNPQAQENL